MNTYATVLALGDLDNWDGAHSLGPFLTGWSGFSDWRYEYGHTSQNRVLGPFYLFMITLPSLIGAASRPRDHASFYTQRWADRWRRWV